jgi:hypothetical protein
MVPAKHWRSRVAQTLSGSAADGYAYFFGVTLLSFRKLTSSSSPLTGQHARADVVHRAGAPPCAVDGEGMDGVAALKGNAVQLAAICMIDHVGRIRKVSLPGFAIPQNPELKIDGFTRPSRETCNVVPNTQTVILRRRDRWNDSLSGKLCSGGKTNLTGPAPYSPPKGAAPALLRWPRRWQCERHGGFFGRGIFAGSDRESRRSGGGDAAGAGQFCPRQHARRSDLELRKRASRIPWCCSDWRYLNCNSRRGLESAR